MKANELRIGNLFKYSDNAIIKPEKRGVISSIIADDISFLAHSYNENLIEPIPLTEEWLLSFGFDKKESSTSSLWHIGINYITKDFLFDLVWLENPETINAPNAPFYRNGMHTIFYVHQLQNLYFALTGKELTLKS